MAEPEPNLFPTLQVRNEFWRGCDLPELTRALSKRYPGVRIKAELAQHEDDQPFQRIVFTAPMPLLVRHGLTLGAVDRCLNEFGTVIVGSTAEDGSPCAIHFHHVHTGEEKGMHSRSQHPDNTKTRAIVGKLLKRIAKGVAHD